MTTSPSRPATGPNLTPILAITTAVFFVTTVLFGLMALVPNAAPIKTSAIQHAAAANTEATIKDVASRFTSNLLTYNYKSVDADIQRALNDATPNFTSATQNLPGGSVTSYKAQIVEGQGTSTTEVLSVAITSRDADTATVLVNASRTFDSNKRTQPATGLAVVELTLKKTASGWKVDHVGSPATSSG